MKFLFVAKPQKNVAAFIVTLQCRIERGQTQCQPGDLAAPGRIRLARRLRRVAPDAKEALVNRVSVAGFGVAARRVRRTFAQIVLSRSYPDAGSNAAGQRDHVEMS